MSTTTISPLHLRRAMTVPSIPTMSNIMGSNSSTSGARSDRMDRLDRMDRTDRLDRLDQSLAASSPTPPVNANSIYDFGSFDPWSEEVSCATSELGLRVEDDLKDLKDLKGLRETDLEGPLSPKDFKDFRDFKDLKDLKAFKSYSEVESVSMPMTDRSSPMRLSSEPRDDYDGLSSAHNSPGNSSASTTISPKDLYGHHELHQRPQMLSEEVLLVTPPRSASGSISSMNYHNETGGSFGNAGLSTNADNTADPAIPSNGLYGSHFSLNMNSGSMTPHSDADVYWAASKTPMRSLSIPSDTAAGHSSMLATPVSVLNTPLGQDGAACPLDLEASHIAHRHGQHNQVPAGGNFSPMMLMMPSTPTNAGMASLGTNPFYRPPPCMRSHSLPCEDESSLGLSPDLIQRKPVMLDSPPMLGKRRRAKSSASAAAINPDIQAATAAAAVADPIDGHANSDPYENSSSGHIMSANDQRRKMSMAGCNKEATEAKPFACEQCGKSFRRMEHLKRHMKVHTMERPYSCSVPGCDRKFSRSDNLKAHILTHAKPKGRNLYVEGLIGEKGLVTPIKRRKVKDPKDIKNAKSAKVAQV